MTLARKEKRDLEHRLIRLAAVQALAAAETARDTDDFFALLASQPDLLGLAGLDEEERDGLDVPEEGRFWVAQGADLASQAWKEKERLDGELKALLLDRWPLERLNSPLRALLRFAIWEIDVSRVPRPVAINEAIELARALSDEESAGMVAAILGRFRASS